MFDRVSNHLEARSAALLVSLESRLDRLLQAWLLFVGLASAARIATAPVPRSELGVVSVVAPYVLLVLAPLASTLLALRWFKDGDKQPQPTTRLARVGKWQSVAAAEAQRHPLYGATGIMVSLLLGILLNAPMRALEYFAAMPAVPIIAPRWLSVLHLAMSLDVVVFTSLYMIAFVAALRRVPLFPRLLLTIWIGDLAMQVFTAQMVGSTHVPAGVAAALQNLLTGNVKKVLISMAIWLPYLLLSKRVNVTYRHRIPA